jgi:uncharacterized protein
MKDTIMDIFVIARRVFFTTIFILFYGLSWYMGKLRAEHEILNITVSKPMSIETFHGTLTLDDALIIELIKSPAMQRLKNIRQYGSADYVIKHNHDYTRFEHSLGVLYILHKHGASRQEQIAGLLHDVSHTVFSHTTEELLNKSLKYDSYQDAIHQEFIRQYGIEDILNKYGVEMESVFHYNGKCKAVKQPLPALCADRIEYNLSAGLIDGLITKEDFDEIHEALNFSGDQWYFSSVTAAKKFARIPLYESLFYWQSPASLVINHWTCQALRNAWEIGLISLDDMHFNIHDDAMWERLSECHDRTIRSYINKILNYEEYMELGTCDDYDMWFKGKFRGVDPLVETETGLCPLTTLDFAFKKEYDQTRRMIELGWYIKWREPEFVTGTPSQSR